MKKSGILKALAAFVLFFSVAIGALATISVVFAFESGAQFDGGRELTEYVARDLSWRYAEEIADHYEALEYGSVSNGVKYAFDHRYSEEHTNVRYSVTADDGRVIFNNLPQASEFNSLVFTQTSRCIPEIIYSDGNGEVEIREIRVTAGILTDAEPVDYIYWVFKYITVIAMYYNWVITLAALSLLVAVICVVFICVSAGHSKKSEGIHLGFFAKLPIEIYLALTGIIFAGCLAWIEEFSNDLVWIAAPIVLLIILIGVLFSIAARLKSKGWYKNSIIIKLIALIYKYVLRTIALILKKFFSVLVRINLYWKTALTGVLFFFLYLIGALSIRDGGMLVILIVFFFHTALLIKFILDLRILEKTGEEICGGNVKAKAETSKLLPSLRNHAESLNGISAGFDEAVKKSIKSERMRSELITNVSHDIKTPLTSLINYVGLLKKEGLSSERALEYLDVLERQSARLQKLTEDLVEASKAASGNLTVNAEDTDVNIILSQALGEYEEKLNSKHLNIVVRKEEDVNTVYADGKLTWRIFDNLLSNVCKYALSGTRIFIEIDRKGDFVQAVFKNVSAEPLELTAEELMERFVRGDSSRNTEGSGLGLSIAKSLAELQGGTFKIDADGDLFKATVTFPIRSR